MCPNIDLANLRKTRHFSLLVLLLSFTATLATPVCMAVIISSAIPQLIFNMRAFLGPPVTSVLYYYKEYKHTLLIQKGTVTSMAFSCLKIFQYLA